MSLLPVCGEKVPDRADEGQTSVSVVSCPTAPPEAHHVSKSERKSPSKPVPVSEVIG